MRVYSKDGHAGIMVGDGKRIPFGIWFDTDTGEYEAFASTPDGRNILCERDCVTPKRVRGKCEKITLVPCGGAVTFDIFQPKKLKDPEAGVEQYKKVYTEVWHARGESMRCVDQRWVEYVQQSDFLDDLVIRRRSHRTS